MDAAVTNVGEKSTRISIFHHAIMQKTHLNLSLLYTCIGGKTIKVYKVAGECHQDRDRGYGGRLNAGVLRIQANLNDFAIAANIQNVYNNSLSEP